VKALDAAARILPYYNEWFGTPYPLPKLDMVAGAGGSVSGFAIAMRATRMALMRVFARFFLPYKPASS